MFPGYHSVELSTSKFMDVNNEKRPCFEGDNYIQVESDMIGKLVQEKFGCTSPYIDQKNRHGAEICRNATTGEAVHAFLETSTGMFGTNVWRKNYFMPPPCTYNTYSYVQSDFSASTNKYRYVTLENIQEGKKNKDKTYKTIIYFVSKMNVNEQFFAYTFMAYIAECGGFVGLFLGYSLLQIGEILQYCRERMYKISKK